MNNCRRFTLDESLKFKIATPTKTNTPSWCSRFSFCSGRIVFLPARFACKGKDGVRPDSLRTPQQLFCAIKTTVGKMTTELAPGIGKSPIFRHSSVARFMLRANIIIPRNARSFANAPTHADYCFSPHYLGCPRDSIAKYADKVRV